MNGKIKYRIRNWSQYNKSLVQRGSINIWLSEDAIEKWTALHSKHKQGRPYIYSDDAILTALIIRSVFNLPLRSLQGFLLSIMSLMKLDLPIPSYSQISRRSQTLGKKLSRISRKRVTDIVIDSTGLKVFGEGEWKVRQHGYSKRRTWKKLHLAVCPMSSEIICEVLTPNYVADSTVFDQLIDDMPNSVDTSYGDGAYDKESCYHKSYKRGIKHIAPPQKNAVFRQNDMEWMDNRNNAIREIVGLGNDSEARRLWKILIGYHKRSIAETAMFRFKQLFGGNLRSRRYDTQQSEARAKCIALNKMTSLGMPKGKWCYC